MNSVKEVETFFNKSLSKNDLEKIIDKLDTKKAFVNQRKFISTYHNKSESSFSNLDIIKIALFENQILGIFNNRYIASKNVNQSVSKDVNQVIQKMAYDVFRGIYKSGNELKNTIDTYCTGRNYNLEGKNFDALINETRKEYYYNSEASKKNPENSYNQIKNFNPERTKKIDALVTEQVRDFIKLNQPPFRISQFLQKIQNYSTKKIPEFLTKEITAKNFDKALKSCVEAQCVDKPIAISEKLLTQSASYLMDKMSVKEKEKLTEILKEKGCRKSQQTFVKYLNNLVSSKERTATKNIAPKEKEYSRGW